MRDAEVSAYAQLVGRVYGADVQKVFERIVAKNRPTDFTLDSVLDQARCEVYREQNEIAATSGYCCFDSDGDL